MNGEREVREISGGQLIEWKAKAVQNVEKWGLQDFEELNLAIDEEHGEFCQAYHEATYEDPEGNPLDEQQDLSECTTDQLERVEEELRDTIALYIQMQALINQAKDA